MATAPGTRLAPWLFGDGLTAAAALVVVLATSTLTSVLSAGLLVQLAFGGAMPPKVFAAAGLLAVGAVFVGLGVLMLFAFLS